MTDRRVMRHPTIVRIVLIAISLILVLILVHSFIRNSFQNNNEDQQGISTVTLSQLEKVLEIAEFSSLESIYNAVATKYDGDSPVYYVAYKGRITAGFDYSEITIAYSSETMEIVITLPDPIILDTSVDMGTLEYIFLDSDYETESVALEAYQLCAMDLQERASSEESLLSLAKNSAISTVFALFDPWLHQLDESYNLVVR